MTTPPRDPRALLQLLKINTNASRYALLIRAANDRIINRVLGR